MAIWQLGFRPFFLAGIFYTAIPVFYWVLFFHGFRIDTGMPAGFFHAYEMIFGFVLAIVAGFLLTASQNWAGKRGVNGSALIFLFLLWLVGRIVIHTDFHWLGLLFLPALIYFLRPYLSGRNMIFIPVLIFFWIFQILMHLFRNDFGFSLAGISYSRVFHASAGLIVLLMTLIGGRVLPFFTGRAVENARLYSFAWIERLSPVVVILWLICRLFLGSSPVTSLVASVAFAVHMIRFVGWRPHQSYRVPILWILFIGYAWILLGFALDAMSVLLKHGFDPALHAFTAGGMGVFIYGMVSRVSLGHTARPIHASSSVVAGYLILNMGVLIRIVGALQVLPFYGTLMAVSAILWSLAFLILFVVYVPILTSPRCDGAEG